MKNVKAFLNYIVAQKAGANILQCIKLPERSLNTLQFQHFLGKKVLLYSHIGISNLRLIKFFK